MSEALRVSVAGLGTVGSSVLKILDQQQERFQRILGRPIQVVAVLDRSHRRKPNLVPPGVPASDSLAEFLQVPTDIVVEVVGGSGLARELLFACTERGLSLVTANKLVVAEDGAQLFAQARCNGSILGFEATVAGGIPILRALRRSLLADQIQEIRGILNGTCNYILSEMASRGQTFQRALDQAQTLGYAEADPQLDISGQDTVDKLIILTAMAIGHWPARDSIPVQGITELEPIDFRYAERLGGVLRLLGVITLTDTTLHLRVSPFLVDQRLQLAPIHGALNAVEVRGRRLGPVLFTGAGAGGDPTAISVTADILNVGAQLTGPRPRTLDPIHHSPVERVAVDEDVYPFYLRFVVEDRPGILAETASLLASHGINIDSVYQESWNDRAALPFAISVDPTPARAVRQALDAIRKLPFLRLPPLALPILR